jgi:hypothetical protein
MAPIKEPQPNKPTAAEDAKTKAAADAAKQQNARSVKLMIATLLRQNGISINEGIDSSIDSIAKQYDYRLLSPEVIQGILESKKPEFSALSTAFDSKFKKGIDMYEKNFGHRLTYAEYLSYENAANQIFAKYGARDILTPDVLHTVVGNGVDQSELDNRFQIASEAVNNMDDFTRQQFKSAFPTAKTDTDIMKAMLLGKDKGSAWLKTKVDVADITAAYNRLGVSEEQQVAAGELLRSGMSAKGIVQSIGQTAGEVENLNRLSAIYGEDATATARETFKESAGGPASKRRARLNALEKAAFSGTSGVGSTSLKSERAGII